VFPSIAELMAGAHDYAKDLGANCSPLAMAAIKAQVAADWHRTRDESEAEAVQLIAEPARRPDFSEGVASYVERRPPRFLPLPPKASGNDA
jgi:enoyl-CoA hydratase/carnithine racemase